MKHTVDYVKTGKNLKQILSDKNISVNELAEKMECSPRTIRDWINAKTKISTKSLIVLMWALETESSDIIMTIE